MELQCQMLLQNCKLILNVYVWGQVYNISSCHSLKQVHHSLHFKKLVAMHIHILRVFTRCKCNKTIWLLSMGKANIQLLYEVVILLHRVFQWTIWISWMLPNNIFVLEPMHVTLRLKLRARVEVWSWQNNPLQQVSNTRSFWKNDLIWMKNWKRCASRFINLRARSHVSSSI